MSVADWPFDRRLQETLQRALPRLGPGVRAQVEAILTPEALAIVAGVLVAWVVSHAFGVGQAIDIIIAAVGVVSIGLAVFTGLDHLWNFGYGAYNARSEADLDRAAEHFAQAVAILGIQAVLAVLFRGRPQTRPVRPAGPAPRTPGVRYRPTTTYRALPPGYHGTTDSWGNIVISTRISAREQALALAHEQVHQALTPRLYPLRNFRVANRDGSYFGSSLWRFLEESLAQTVALVGQAGFRQIFVGIRFPVQNGYVFLLRRGGFSSAMRGAGVLTEGAGLIATGLLAGDAYELWFKADVSSGGGR